jgi:hypothetical protein
MADITLKKDLIEGISKELDETQRASLYYSLYEEARNFDVERFDEYVELLAYYEMEQDNLPANQTNKPWVLNITTPYAADAINTRVSSFISNEYVGELQPLSPDDVEKIEKLNRIYKMFWHKMQMDNKVSQATLYAAILRESYVHVIFDDKIHGGTNRKVKGKLDGYFVDPASILIDPHSLDFKNADYIVITERITTDQYERDFGEKYEAGKGSSYQPSERGEIYAGSDYSSNQENVLTKLTFYIKGKDNKITKVIMVEKEIMSEKELPISVYPIAQLRYEKKIKSPYGRSLMDRILPLQKSINAIESAATTAALAFSSPSYAVRLGSGVNPAKVAALAGAPGAVFEVDGDPTTAIVPISNAKIDPQLIKIRQDNQSELYRLAGVSEQFLGSFGSAGNTKGGSEEASMRARVVENLFLQNLEEFIEDLTQIIVEFATKAFDGETLYSRGEKKTNNEYDWEEFEVTGDMKDLEYAFYINMDIKSPYSKEKAKQLLQELWQMERQYDAPIKTVQVLDIIKQYNIPNVDELVDRYKQLSNRDSEKKSQIIVQFVMAASQAGVDANLISQGISEIINGKETPTVDRIISQIEQQARQAEQAELQRQQQLAAKQTNLAQQQMMEQYRQQMSAQQSQPQLTGDEVLGQEQAPAQMSGDEVLGQ